MADVTYDPLTETTALDAASVNDRFTGVTAAVNALMAESVQQMCFNENHLPSMVVQHLHRWITGAPTHSYQEASGWTTIDNNGDTGGLGSPAEDLSLDFSAGHTLANAGPIGGILVLVDINLQRISGAAATHTGADDAVADFRIQIEYNSSWVTVDRTIRTVNARALGSDGVNLKNQFINVNLWTLITKADVATSHPVTKVRVQAIAREDTGGALVTNVTATLYQCHITALVLRSEKS